MNAVGADRAKQHTVKAAVPAVTYDQQVGACRRLNQDLTGMALHHPGPQRGRMIRSEYLIDSVGECMPGETGEVRPHQVGRRPAVERRELRGGDGIDGGASQLSLAGSPPERVF